jgi:hypothetical protein
MGRDSSILEDAGLGSAKKLLTAKVAEETAKDAKKDYSHQPSGVLPTGDADATFQKTSGLNLSHE